MLTRP
jgi:hypothetical protein